MWFLKLKQTPCHGMDWLGDWEQRYGKALGYWCRHCGAVPGSPCSTGKQARYQPHAVRAKRAEKPVADAH